MTDFLSFYFMFQPDERFTSNGDRKVIVIGVNPEDIEGFGQTKPEQEENPPNASENGANSFNKGIFM